MKLCPKCGKHFPDDANFCPVDAGRLEVVDDDGAGGAGGELGGRFELGQRIGGGTTGEVFEATDKQGAGRCVVKLVDPDVFPTPLLLQRTERELKQLERLEAAGVARVLDHGKRDGQLWIATEAIEGTRLDVVVAERGPMEAQRAARIIHAVGQALADAAKLGVIHRDLSPKNLLLGPGDQVKVINFGVAVPTTDRVQGVPEFVAPEQIEGKPVDQRSNIYSLGALYYFMLTGAPPYSGDVDAVFAAHLDENPPALPEHVQVPDHINALVLKALARTSSKRFMTLRQLLGQLEAIVEGKEPGATQPLGKFGSGTQPGPGPGPQGKGKDKALSGTLLGMAALSDKADHRDNSETIPMDRPPVRAVSDSEVTAKMTDAPVEPQVARPDLAPEPAQAVDSAPAGKGRIEVDDDAATQQMPARRDAAPEPVAVDDDTAPAPSLRHHSGQPRAASQSEGSASGKTTSRKTKKKKKSGGKFRETMWFKKGELDEAAAEAAAQDKDGMASDKADAIPIEDRYADDGSLSDRDQERLSLRTGGTQGMEAVRERPQRGSTEVSEEELLREMSGNRTKLIVAGGVALLVIVVIIIIAAN